MPKVDLGQVIDTTDVIYRDIPIPEGYVDPLKDVFVVMEVGYGDYAPISATGYANLINEWLSYTPVLGGNACVVHIQNHELNTRYTYGGYIRVCYKKKLI